MPVNEKPPAPPVDDYLFMRRLLAKNRWDMDSGRLGLAKLTGTPCLKSSANGCGQTKRASAAQIV